MALSKQGKVTSRESRFVLFDLGGVTLFVFTELNLQPASLGIFRELSLSVGRDHFTE